MKALRGDRAGQWSIRINDQWRICFVWDDGPSEVEIVDYHQREITMERLPNIHPGEVLREDYLIPLGKSAYWSAKGLRMSQTAVGEILAGKRAIMPATALRLSRFFGSSAEFWLNLQASYDLEEERLRSGELLRDVEPADLDEEWQIRVRDLEHRRRELHARLFRARERLAGELEAIEPAASASA